MSGPVGSQQCLHPRQVDYQLVEARLHKVENPWKRGRDKAQEQELTETEKARNKLIRDFRGILNKITPQKFQSLLKLVLELPVKTEADLDAVMNMLFEKAINEPLYAVTYANLSQKIAKVLQVPSKDNPNEDVNFRKLLLCRCQREFERSDDDRELVSKREGIERASAEEKSKHEVEFEVFLTKAKRRKLGNIRFIGELFKLSMLVTKIMHACVVTLLQSSDEENLECLCRLLTTIGKELDTPDAKPRTDQYFHKMKKISTGQMSKKVSSRIRFALQDVLELRDNNWVPRREDSNPKTIDQVHAEAALEAHEKQIMLSQLQPSRGSWRRFPHPLRSSALAAARQISRPGGSQSPSRNSSLEGRNMRPPTPTRGASVSTSKPATPSPTVAPVKQLSRDEWDNKTKSTLDECIHTMDTEKLEYMAISSSTSASNANNSADGGEVGERRSADLATNLDRLLLKESASNESVFDWIDLNISESRRASDTQFIKILAYTIFKASIENGEKLVEELLKSRSPLLAKYLDSKPEREAAALSSLEELMDQLQHPAELLSDTCYLLVETYDGLFSDESFLVWESTSRGSTALQSLKQFFKWLKFLMSKRQPELVARYSADPRDRSSQRIGQPTYCKSKTDFMTIDRDGFSIPPREPMERDMSPSDDKETPTNKFSALSDRDGANPRRRSGQRMGPISRNSMGRGGSMGRDKDRFSVTPRGSMEKERSSAFAAASQISRPGGSRGPSRDSRLEGRNMRPSTPTRGASVSASKPATPSPTAAPVKQLSRDEWENKMKSTLDELIHNKDMKEALARMKELGQQQEMYLLTECSINHILERSSLARKQTGHFFAELIKKQVFSLEMHVKGLNSILEFAEDLAIDIPSVWQYLAELMAPMFFEAEVSLKKLEELCKPLVDIGKAATLAAAVLEEASHSVGHVELGRKWQAAGLKWSSFLGPGEDEELFVSSHKLEYTVISSSTYPSNANNSADGGGGGETPSADLATNLDRLLLKKSASNELVFDWIDLNISESRRASDTQFIKILAYNIFKASIDNGDKLVEELLKSRSPLLVKYLDSKPEREAAALSSLEELMDQLQHPAELLSDFCYLLAETDDGLISDDSFLAWESTSKSGTAIKSLKKFFQWLKDVKTTDKQQ